MEKRLFFASWKKLTQNVSVWHQWALFILQCSVSFSRFCSVTLFVSSLSLTFSDHAWFGRGISRQSTFARMCFLILSRFAIPSNQDWVFRLENPFFWSPLLFPIPNWKEWWEICFQESNKWSVYWIPLTGLQSLLRAISASVHLIHSSTTQWDCYSFTCEKMESH